MRRCRPLIDAITAAAAATAPTAAAAGDDIGDGTVVFSGDGGDGGDGGYIDVGGGGGDGALSARLPLLRRHLRRATAALGIVDGRIAAVETQLMRAVLDATPTTKTTSTTKTKMEVSASATKGGKATPTAAASAAASAAKKQKKAKKVRYDRNGRCITDATADQSLSGVGVGDGIVDGDGDGDGDGDIDFGDVAALQLLRGDERDRVIALSSLLDGRTVVRKMAASLHKVIALSERAQARLST
jgi:hypothetical protein